MKKFLSIVLATAVISSSAYTYDKNNSVELESATSQMVATTVEESTTKSPSDMVESDGVEQSEAETVTKKIDETTTKKKVESTTEKKATTTSKPAVTEPVIDSIKPVTANPSPEEQLAFDLLNEYRAEQGLYPLKWNNDVLHAAAEIRATECPVKWAHERPDGTNFATILVDNGYRYAHASENLCAYTAGAENLIEKMMQCLKDSPSHNKAMLTARDVEVGIAFYEAEDGKSYLVQIFGVRQNNT